MSAPQKVTIRRDDHVAIVTIDRPEARNAIDPEVALRLADAWAELRDDPEVRAIVVTGAGETTFSSGADLGRMITLFNGGRSPEDEWDKRLMSDIFVFDRTLLRDFDAVKPVIAAINGDAIAGGMELMQGCDIRVVADHARFGLQEVKWGLFPAGGSTARLPRQIPYAIAMELLLTGDLISARRAYEVGLVNYVLPREQVLPKALEIARRIAENGPLAVREVRKSARTCIGMTEQEGLLQEKMFAAPVFMSRDAREGPRAFKEKRKPNFEGR